MDEKTFVFESAPGNPETNLDLDKYHSAYARIFSAAVLDEDGSPRIDSEFELTELFSTEELSDVNFGDIDVEKIHREYNHVVNGASKYERTESWKGKEFKEAYSLWSDSLRSSMLLTSDENRKAVISHFTGKNSTDITAMEIQSIYDTYCNGRSDIDAFVNRALAGNLNIEATQWLAGRLFGNESAKAVARIIELESTYNSIQDKNDFFKLIYDPTKIDRLNLPSDEEEQILKFLFNHYERTAKIWRPAETETHESKQSGTSQPAATAPDAGKREPAEPKPTKDMAIRARMILTKEGSEEKFYIRVEGELSRVRKLNEAIAAIRRGDQNIIDPDTGEPLPVFIDQDHAIHHLEARIMEARAAKQADMDREISIVNINDGRVAEVMTKKDLKQIFLSEHPKYARSPYEREIFKIAGLESPYILQTFYDKTDQQEKVRFYLKPDVSNDDFVKEMPMDEFLQLLERGQIEWVDKTIPSSPSASEEDKPAPIASDASDKVEGFEPMAEDDIFTHLAKQPHYQEAQRRFREAMLADEQKPEPKVEFTPPMWNPPSPSPEGKSYWEKPNSRSRTRGIEPKRNNKRGKQRRRRFDDDE